MRISTEWFHAFSYSQTNSTMNTHRINWQQWLFALLVLAAGVVSFGACSKDETEMNDPDKGKENTSDMVVTGGIGEFKFHSGWTTGFSVDVSGYLNIPDEVKATLGMGAQIFGVEVSRFQNFPEEGTQRITARRLDDGRKFTVATADTLREQTLYYYRSFFGMVYGSTETFTTPAYADVIDEQVVTDDPTSVGDNSVRIPLSGMAGAIAYDTDASKLTLENIRENKVKTKYGYGDVNGYGDVILSDLENGTTYYYCAFRFLGSYESVGEVKSFTTTGFNFKEILKGVTANCHYDESKFYWTADITTSLASKFPGHDIKYAIKAYLYTDYPNYSSDQDWFTVTRYGGDDKKIYAEGSGNTYTAVTYPPMYWGAHYNDRLIDGLEFDSDNLMNYEGWQYLRARIEAGIANEDEKSLYEEYFGGDRFYEWEYNQSIYQYIHNYLDVIVEIDGKEYVVKTQEGKLRMIWDM